LKGGLNIDNKDYSDLINMSLDTNDKKWFNELILKRKQELEKARIINIHKNIALENMDNNSYAIQTEEGIRLVKDLEDAEKHNIIRVSSKRLDAIRIFKGEEINVEELSIESKYYYKLAIQQYLKGFNDAESIYKPYFDENFKLQNQVDSLTSMIKLLIEQNKMLLNRSCNNSKNKFNLKGLFKKEGD
jgi:hypothetical protein